MAADRSDTTRFSLRRWSQRKLAAARNDDPAERRDAVVRADAVAPAALPTHSEAGNARRERDAAAHGVSGATAAPVARARATGADAPAPAIDQRTSAPRTVEPALPPVDSLTIESDFTPFMRPDVDPDVKRTALRKLFRDPRFNVMDGLDVYIDDYSKPSPIEPELVRTLMQARYIFAPPQTRVTAEGHVEDVPDVVAPPLPTTDASDADAAQPRADAGRPQSGTPASSAGAAGAGTEDRTGPPLTGDSPATDSNRQ
jgi:hypothetical protein